VERAVEPLTAGRNKAGDIRARDFSGASGGVLAEWSDGGAFTLSTTAMRTFLAPSVEHLFAEGPHLAAYAYEIGNTELAAETGRVLSVAARWERGGKLLQVEGFRNDFEHYLHSADTGQLEIGPGAEGMLERFQYRGDPARLVGLEARVRLGEPDRWSVEAEAGHVIGTLARTGRPLTQMPPLHGRLSARVERRQWHGGLTATGSTAQHRLGDFETSTAAHAQLSAELGWERHASDHTLSVFFAADNLTNAEHRDHLSRLKSVMPGPGRSLRLVLSASR
jgi:iron complex outermembrane receptor protein